MKICLEILDTKNFQKLREKVFEFYPKGDEATLYNEVCQYIELNKMYNNNECYDWYVVKELEETV